MNCPFGSKTCLCQSCTKNPIERKEKYGCRDCNDCKWNGKQMHNIGLCSDYVAQDGDQEMNDLRKCPFCDGEAQIVQSKYGTAYAVGCDGKYGSNCPGYVWKMTPLYFTRQQATRFWNNEHQSDIGLDTVKPCIG